MAKISKEGYVRKREWAATRMAVNAVKGGNSGLTENQTDLLEELCSLRHDLHCNLAHVVHSDEQGLKKDLVEINVEIKSSGLPHMAFIPSGDVADYIDIDTIDLLHEYGEFDYDEEFARIYGSLMKLHSQIEIYLSEIDKQYATDYCPTGATRTS